MFTDHFYGIPASELTPEKMLRRRLRQINIRETHTGSLPYWPSSRPEPERLVELLADHGLEVAQEADTVVARQMHGRVYTFTWNGTLRKWFYVPTEDPISGLEETRLAKARSATLWDQLEEESPQAPKSVWWDGQCILEGDFMAFDLETTLIWPGEFPEIVLGSAGTEKGNAVLLRKGQLVDFFLMHHKANPTQIWCGWNIGGFDIPTMDFRLPRFRETVHEIMMEKLANGYLYDTMLFVQLLDIGIYGDTFNRKKGAELYPVWWGRGWGRAVYALGPQCKRWLGMDINKGEGITFWEYLGREEEITEDQAAYAMADASLVANIQKVLWNFPAVRMLAKKAAEEMAVLDGVMIEEPDPEIHSDLHLAAKCKFGWQTHTIQLLGAMSLSWVSANGIEVDIEHCTKLIGKLNLELDRRLQRLSGDPGRIIYRIAKGTKREKAWVPEKVDAYKILVKLKDREKDSKIEWEVTDVRKLEVYEPGKEGARYQFVNGKAIRKINVSRYVSELMWHKLDDRLRRKSDPDRLGLRSDDWLYFFDISDVADIPDEVLRLNFQAATIMKKIANTKTYFPGVCDRNRKKQGVDKFKKMEVDVLLRRLGLEGVKKGRLFPSFRPLLATGRTGARDPNTQQVERDNRFRNCFVAADGRCFMACDYGAAEMVTQAEIYVHRYGRRTLCRYMNDGFDVHLLTAMQFQFPTQKKTWMPILGDPVICAMKKVVELDEKKELAEKLMAKHEWFKMPSMIESGEDIAKDVWIHLLATELLPDTPFKVAKGEIKRARQAAKVVNFGVPGGMRPPKIRQLAKTDYGMDMTREESEVAYTAWLKMFPEGKQWCYDGRQYLIEDPPFPFRPYYDRCFTLTGRMRGHRVAAADSEYDVGLNEWHNTQFQGLAADAAKIALYLTWREGLIQVNFVHDEIDFEVPKALIQEHQLLSTARMRVSMNNVVKHVGITVGSGVTERWEKG